MKTNQKCIFKIGLEKNRTCFHYIVIWFTLLYLVNFICLTVKKIDNPKEAES